MTPFPRAQFKELIASILNLHPDYVTWQGEKEAAAMKPSSPYLWASVTIAPRVRQRIGWDQLRRTDNADGSFSTLQTGRRQFVLSLTMYTYDSIDVLIADDVLDDLATKLWQPVNLDQLNAMGLVFENTGPLVTLPTFIDARYISAAVAELTLALSATDEASYPGINKTVGEVTGTGTYSGDESVTQTVDVKENVPP